MSVGNRHHHLETLDEVATLVRVGDPVADPQRPADEGLDLRSQPEPGIVVVGVDDQQIAVGSDGSRPELRRPAGASTGG